MIQGWFCKECKAMLLALSGASGATSARGLRPYQCLCHVEALSRVAVKEAKQEGLPCL